MALANYTELADAIGGWLNRTNLTARIPDFIRLVEVRLNRLLRDPDMIETTTISFANGEGALPADFGEIVSFGPVGRRLTPVTPGEFGTYNPQSGDPRVYSINGSTISVLPSTGSPSIPFSYYRSIPALTSGAPTNWLLTRAPDVYLYGALAHAEFFGWNDERLQMIKDLFDESIGELRVDGSNRRWGAAPVSPKLGRT